MHNLQAEFIVLIFHSSSCSSLRFAWQFSFFKWTQKFTHSETCNVYVFCVGMKKE